MLQANVSNECKLEAQKTFEMRFMKHQFIVDFRIQDSKKRTIDENGLFTFQLYKKKTIRY